MGDNDNQNPTSGGSPSTSQGNAATQQQVTENSKVPPKKSGENPRLKDIEIWTYEEIDKRNKPVIIDALLAQRLEAENLSRRCANLEQSLTDLRKKVVEVKNSATTEVDQNLSAYDAAAQFETRLDTIQNALRNVNLDAIETLESQKTQATSNSGREHRQYKLDPNTPKFGGAPGERLTQWLFIIEDAFEAQEVRTDFKKLALISNYVKGSVLNALIRYKNSSVLPTWAGFTKMLKDQYEDTTLDYKLRTQLNHLKMEGSFPKYLARFQELVNQIPDLAGKETDVLVKFTDGLTKDYAFAVRRDKSKTLNQAIGVCQDLDCVTKSYNEHDRKEKDSVNMLKKVNFSKFQPRLRNFGKKVNFTKFSYNKKPFRKFENKSDKGRVAFDIKNVTCVKCKQKGHYANKCPSKHKKVNSISVHAGDKYLEGLMCVSGTVDGNPAVMTLDSGATACIISQRFANEIKLKINPSDVQVKVADNEVRNVLGVTDKLHVEVKGHACDLEMYVMNHDDYEVLLGLPWFMATQAGINPSERTLKFKSETFSLEDEAYIDTEPIDRVLLSEFDTFDGDDVEGDIDWTGSPFKGIIPVAKVTDVQRRCLDRLSKQIKGDFAKDFKDLGKCTVLPYKIRVTSDKIIFRHPYRKSIVEQAKIQEEVDKMLAAGVISVSKSPHSSPILMIPKKDGSSRMCIDYRELNKVTEPENLPLPNIRDIFDRLSGKNWMSTLDLKAGYWQCVLDRRSRDLTAFSTNRNRYCFNVVPFGAVNAPGHFQNLMLLVLGHLPFVEIYLDDICIASEDFDTHCQHVLTVFKALRQANLKVNAEKCVWFANEVHLLGHVISGSNLKMDPKKVECVKNRSPPTSVKEVQQFLGLTGYYRSHIKDYANLARPLYELVKKDVKFVWGQEQQEAFEKLKQSLVEYPVLRLPVLDRQFIIYTDSSAYCSGGVLAQVDPKDGREYVIAYASRMFKGAEKFYGVTEKECLAILFCVKQWRVYLCKRFIVISDHNALSWLMNIKEPCARLCRWAIYLQAFDFEIRYKKGKLHTNADAISRPPLPPNEKAMALQLVNVLEEIDFSPKSLCPLEDEGLLHFLKYGRHLVGSSQKQKRRVEKLEKHYKLTADNLLLFKKKLDSEEFVRYPQKEERLTLIIEAHNLGHFAKLSTLQRLKERYFWKGMEGDVEKAIARCVTCQRNDKAPALYHPAISMEVDHVFDSIVIDCSFGFPVTKEGYHGVLVIMERLTRFPFVYPLKSKEASEVAECLLDYICLAGPSRSLQSDCGAEFLNKIIDALLKSTGIDRKTSSAYNPRVQGICEKFNSTLAEALRKCGEQNKDNWHKFIPFVLLAYRSRIHSSHGYSPFELLFARKMNHFGNWKETPSSDETAQLYQRTLELKRLVEITHPKAKENMAKSRERQERIQNSQNTTTDVRLAPGTMVFLKVEGLLTKMAPRYAGPYKVVRSTDVGNYILENSLGEEMKRSYPRHKIKAVADPSAEGEINLEVDEIVDSKFENNEEFFLVKWKNSTEQDWIAGSCFNSIEPINAYNRKKALEAESLVNKQHDETIRNIKEAELEVEAPRKAAKKRRSKSVSGKSEKKKIENENVERKRKRGRPSFKEIREREEKDKKGTGKRSRLKRINSISSMLISLLVVFLKVAVFVALKITDDFMFCDPSELKMVDVSGSCVKSRGSKNIIDVLNNKNSNTKWEEFHVFNKAKHLISGHASECSMVKAVVVTSQGWFGTNYIDDFEEINMVVTERMCREMARTRACNNEPMKCVDNECFTSKKINKTFSYWTTKRHEVINCRLVNRFVVADSLDEPLFDSLNCRPIDGVCSLSASIIVWDSSIVHSCPLFYVISANLTKMSKLEGEETNILVANDKNLLFNLVDKEIITNCRNILFYKTSQGLYLTLDKRALALPAISNEVTDLNKLILAETDMDKFRLYEDTRHVAFEVCLMLENILRLATTHHNQYFTMTDTNDEEIILYVKEGNVFIPKCVDLSDKSISFEDETKSEDLMCDVDVKVEYQVGNNVFKGYLDVNNIISPYSSKRCVYPCEKIDQIHYFKKNSKVLKRIGHRLELVDNVEKLNAKPLKFGEISFSRLNFRHLNPITDGIDFLKEFRSLNSPKNSKNEVFGSDVSFSGESVNFSMKKFQSWVDSVKFILLYSFLISLLVLIAYLILIWIGGKMTKEMLCNIWSRFKIFFWGGCFKRCKMVKCEIPKILKRNKKRKRIEKISDLDDLIEMVEFKKSKLITLETAAKSSQTEHELVSEIKEKLSKNSKFSNDYDSILPSSLQEYKSLENKYQNGSNDPLVYKSVLKTKI